MTAKVPCYLRVSGLLDELQGVQVAERPRAVEVWRIDRH